MVCVTQDEHVQYIHPSQSKHRVYQLYQCPIHRRRLLPQPVLVIPPEPIAPHGAMEDPLPQPNHKTNAEAALAQQILRISNEVRERNALQLHLAGLRKELGGVDGGGKKVIGASPRLMKPLESRPPCAKKKKRSEKPDAEGNTITEASSSEQKDPDEEEEKKEDDGAHISEDGTKKAKKKKNKLNSDEDNKHKTQRFQTPRCARIPVVPPPIPNTTNTNTSSTPRPQSARSTKSLTHHLYDEAIESQKKTLESLMRKYVTHDDHCSSAGGTPEKKKPNESPQNPKIPQRPVSARATGQRMSTDELKHREDNHLRLLKKYTTPSLVKSVVVDDLGESVDRLYSKSVEHGAQVLKRLWEKELKREEEHRHHDL
eukprot:PhF_6_TR28272/c0_g1_i2/m.41835